MFLSASQSHFKQTCLAKTALTVAVLLLVVHAGASEAIEETVDKTQPDAASSQEQMRDGRVQGQSQRAPRWPQHQQRNKGIIPPPPPGPYTSSALSDYSVAAPSAVHHTRRPSNDHAVPAVPMATFSPDLPWPTNLRPAQRQPDHRVSEQGSHYGKPFYGPVTKNNYSHYNNYGNRPGPYVNDKGMNASRWMPGMTMTPPGPYNNRWNYAPNYGSYYRPQYGSPYGGPVINNNAMRFTNPASR